MKPARPGLVSVAATSAPPEGKVALRGPRASRFDRGAAAARPAPRSSAARRLGHRRVEVAVGEQAEVDAAVVGEDPDGQALVAGFSGTAG